jgi:hypothetical protein
LSISYSIDYGCTAHAHAHDERERKLFTHVNCEYERKLALHTNCEDMRKPEGEGPYLNFPSNPVNI